MVTHKIFMKYRCTYLHTDMFKDNTKTSKKEDGEKEKAKVTVQVIWFVS